MLIIPKPKTYKKHRKYKAISPSPLPPAGPILISAIADFSVASVTLTFDRAIELVSYDPSAIVVSSASNHLYYPGNGTYESAGAETITLFISETDEYPGDENLLHATASTGIRSLSDSVEWSGVSDFVVTVV